MTSLLDTATWRSRSLLLDGTQAQCPLGCSGSERWVGASQPSEAGPSTPRTGEQGLLELPE